MAEVGGWDFNGCTYAWSDNDRDMDGLRDECEYQLARAFRPYMAVDIIGDDNLGREPYWAASLTFHWYNNYVPVIQIMYLQAWYHDGGDPEWRSYESHHGDSEWVVLHIEYQNGRWVLNTATTSAHWNSDAESSRMNQYYELSYPDGPARSRPLIWVAVDKHANYGSLGLCNNGGFMGGDHCGGNTFVRGDPRFEIEVLPNANIGNSFAPAGPLQPDGSYASRGWRLIDYVGSRMGMPGAEAIWGLLSFLPQPYRDDFCGWEGVSRVPEFDDHCASSYFPALSYFHL